MQPSRALPLFSSPHKISSTLQLCQPAAPGLPISACAWAEPTVAPTAMAINRAKISLEMFMAHPLLGIVFFTESRVLSSVSDIRNGSLSGSADKSVQRLLLDSTSCVCNRELVGEAIIKSRHSLSKEHIMWKTAPGKGFGGICI